jgi:ribosomal protein S21
MTAEEEAERERRSREFYELLEKRRQRDAEIAAARKRRSG